MPTAFILYSVAVAVVVACVIGIVLTTWIGRAPRPSYIQAGNAGGASMALDDGTYGPMRRRAERLEVKLSRQATWAVKPIRSRVQAWQSRAAYLKALAEHRRSAGQPVDTIIAEATDMARDIEQERQRLEASGASLPDNVRQHSRFQDMMRALATASSAVKAVMGPPKSA